MSEAASDIPSTPGPEATPEGDRLTIEIQTKEGHMMPVQAPPNLMTYKKSGRLDS